MSKQTKTAQWWNKYVTNNLDEKFLLRNLPLKYYFIISDKRREDYIIETDTDQFSGHFFMFP